MGLDLFIFARKYYGQQDPAQAAVEKIIPAGYPMTSLEIEAVYMRAAWGVYTWLSNHVGKGNNDNITEAQLVDLVADIDTAFKTLDFSEFEPPKGREDYKAYLIEDLLMAKKLVQKALDEIPEGWDFFYLASW